VCQKGGKDYPARPKISAAARICPENPLARVPGTFTCRSGDGPTFLELLGHRAERDRDFVHLDHEHCRVVDNVVGECE
jgi:hypothetical protein